MLGPKSKADIEEAVAALTDVLALTLFDTKFIHETADVVVRQREVLQWRCVDVQPRAAASNLTVHQPTCARF